MLSAVDHQVLQKPHPRQQRIVRALSQQMTLVKTGLPQEG